MSEKTVSHPLFARLYARLSGRMERELWRYRKELIPGLTGKVVEVGAGDGRNFSYYDEATDEVFAVEPEPYLRSVAEDRASDAGCPIKLVDGTAESLPFEDGEFDVAVCCLVLCSVDDQAAALQEIRRVLKPGGSLRFLEHVQSGRPWKARVQRFLDRSGVWPTISGNCHCSHETAAAIASSGFSITEIREFETRPTWGHTAPTILGTAGVS
jgi:ubiquinone/menaquinone biosynthesis C-methylase UbiE